ncbi:MAG: DUF1684 domain-containing protein [Vicinamibacterales bacterium]
MVSRFVRQAAATALVAALAACAPSQSPEEAYTARVTQARVEKDEAFRSSTESPIPPDRKNALLPLAYYPVDEDYAVPAELELSPDRSRLQIPTSTGKLRDYERIGTLRFSLAGTPTQLTAFSEVGQPVSRLFVPFADETSGAETYAAGRYLELDPTATGIYVIDFNDAYHPFCYYNSEMRLPVSSGREPPERPHPRRRAPPGGAAGGTLTRARPARRMRAGARLPT